MQYTRIQDHCHCPSPSLFPTLCLRSVITFEEKNFLSGPIQKVPLNHKLFYFLSDRCFFNLSDLWNIEYRFMPNSFKINSPGFWHIFSSVFLNPPGDAFEMQLTDHLVDSSSYR